eukprot:1890099-Amphidinium_carterae.1
MTKPSTKTWLPSYFNHYVQLDCFTLWGKEWCLLVDELFRYKQAYLMTDRSTECWCKMLLSGWVRYFGPPVHIICDQQSAFSSLEAGVACDKLHITRLLAGADLHKAERGGAHTSTSLVERHIGLLKHTCMTIAAHVDDALDNIDG